MKLFSKVLIANRGAIATRIIRTLDRLGIESVAVYADSDRDSLHVQRATESWSLGAGTAAETYLDVDKLLRIAQQSGCEAVHPGYGFLSENTAFVERCEQALLTFIGPTALQIEQFGQKHIARDLAQAAGVPLPPGTDLLTDQQDAREQAQRIGYPIMLKSTAGGGGIGMQMCHDIADLDEAFATVRRLGASHFSNDGVFLEKAMIKARHIEVQVFGDGEGMALALGERDCSAQRRNQKVIEECPAPNLTSALRERLHSTAEALLASVDYRNAGTVEFIVDADTSEFYFLEVNTRLQVEHGVTELVYGVDLVEWMVKQASGVLVDLSSLKQDLVANGHAVQARIYAEDPFRHFQPCAGPLTHVMFPEGQGIRIDSWIESGITVPADFDPMLAKVMVHADTREASLARLQQTLDNVELYGSETNLSYLQVLSADTVLRAGTMTTRYLDTLAFAVRRIDVLRGGTMTTIQDVPGRTGYWPVGIPPSGPFDSLSFRLANRLLGNDESAAGLEITLQGPALQFSTSCLIVVAGGDVKVTVDGEPVETWSVLAIAAGQVLDIGVLNGRGARACLCVAGGIQCPRYLGSRSTFTLGLFGGHNGAALKAGDVLHLPDCDDAKATLANAGSFVAPELRPPLTHQWSIRVIYGPHGAPDYFTDADISTLFETQWQVHYNSSRTGVRLIGPSPEWARSDGGEAGLHPSNIHDNAYAYGTIDFTGDMPVILGPDGPSLGGFVCPATVINADLWKLGQLRAGDTIVFRAVTIDDAVQADSEQSHAVEHLSIPKEDSGKDNVLGQPVVCRRSASLNGLSVCYRVAGDRFLLIEYGEPKLDLVSRFRVHALMQWLEAHNVSGILEMTPGIRSLQLHYDSHQINVSQLLEYLEQAELELDDAASMASVQSRIVYLPLSWDDEACQQAVQKYDQSVRKDAPWFPSNLEFIRRINGLDSIDAVKQTVFEASYLVMGLGDVYLGAPVATPVNPAHRLVTTKYNPARTWTAENSVGIGGSYLCVYGMEGPGGYQFVGRTLQMWNRYKQTPEFEKPWLLRFFDQIRFYEVSHDALTQIRADFPHGRYSLQIEETEFSLAEFQQMVDSNRSEIDSFQQTRESAFQKELDQWRATGQLNLSTIEPEPVEVTVDWPEDCVVLESPVSGSLWKCIVDVGDEVSSGQTLMILESMKMEINVSSSADLRVRQVLFAAGDRVTAGQPLIVLDTP